jgi:hypothetical protein
VVSQDDTQAGVPREADHPAPEGPEPEPAPAPGLAADLDRAAQRLREQPALEPSAAPRAVPPSSVPRTPATWMQGALRRLHEEDPPAAARLAIALLPVLGRRVSKPGTIDVSLAGSGTYRVRTGPMGAPVEPGAGGGAEVTVHGDVAALAPLLAGGSGRRLEGARVEGRRSRLRRALRAMRRPVGLTEAGAAGAPLDPELVLAALANAIDPAWTKGHRFTVAFVIAGDDERAWHVRVADGAAPAVAEGLPGEGATATLEADPAALQALLGGDTPHPVSGDPRVTGNPHAMTLLGEWMDRAQGLTR